TPSEEGLARDARAAYAYITDSLDVDPQRVLYFGESLGTGVVAELAREHPPAGILLRSPFTSLSDLGKEHYPSVLVSLALSEDYRSSTTLAASKCRSPSCTAPKTTSCRLNTVATSPKLPPARAKRSSSMGPAIMMP